MSPSLASVLFELDLICLYLCQVAIASPGTHIVSERLTGRRYCWKTRILFYSSNVYFIKRRRVPNNVVMAPVWCVGEILYCRIGRQAVHYRRGRFLTWRISKWMNSIISHRSSLYSRAWWKTTAGTEWTEAVTSSTARCRLIKCADDPTAITDISDRQKTADRRAQHGSRPLCMIRRLYEVTNGLQLVHYM